MKKLLAKDFTRQRGLMMGDGIVRCGVKTCNHKATVVLTAQVRGVDTDNTEIVIMRCFACDDCASTELRESLVEHNRAGQRQIQRALIADPATRQRIGIVDWIRSRSGWCPIDSAQHQEPEPETVLVDQDGNTVH